MIQVVIKELDHETTNQTHVDSQSGKFDVDFWLMDLKWGTQFCAKLLVDNLALCHKKVAEIYAYFVLLGI